MSRIATPLSRRLFLAGLLSSAASPALANPPERSLRPMARGEDPRLRNLSDPDEMVAEAGLNGRSGFAVVDVASGEVLEARAGSEGLPPASVAKSLTALYALDVLGPDHRFDTLVMGTGPLEQGVLKGDLVLVGGGDPVLATDDLGAMARRLKDEVGLREVEGRFLVWGGALPRLREIDVLQPEQVGYNPAISGMNLNFNRVHFGWERSGGDYQVTMDARAQSYRPDVTVARMEVADRSYPVYTYEDAGPYDAWTVARGALGNSGARWLPVRKPELYAGEVFRKLMESQDIPLDAPQIAEQAPEGDILARHQSPDLRSVLRDMLKYSTNLTAELVGLTATRVRTGAAPLDLAASAGVMNGWASETLGVEGIALVDHSGLGDDSRVPPEALARALARVRGEGLAPLLKQVHLRDRLGRPIYDSPVTIRAKTGTLNFVSGLAGYVTTEGGRELAFAIFSADSDRRDALTEAQRERPPGGRGWNLRARGLQNDLLTRWALLFDT